MKQFPEMSFAKKPEELPDVLERERSLEIFKEKERAEEIALETGNYDKINEKLKEEGLWENQLSRVQKKFEGLIVSADFPTKEKDLWEMLTTLDLYDEKTARHCIETYKIIKGKIEKVLTGNIIIAQIIEKEQVDLELFYFAAITHDIGKVEIPPFVLKNTLRQGDWEKHFIEMIRAKELPIDITKKLDLGESENLEDIEIIERLHMNNMRAKDLVPIARGLTEEESQELEAKWGYSAQRSIMGIIDEHSTKSGEILSNHGFPETAKIVAQHHHKRGPMRDYPSLDSFYIDTNLTDILHLADVEEALEAVRSYKGSFSELQIIKELIAEVNNGKIGRAMSYFWIKDKQLEYTKRNTFSELEIDDIESLNEIDSFLTEFESGTSKKELEEWMQIHLRN